MKHLLVSIYSVYLCVGLAGAALAVDMMKSIQKEQEQCMHAIDRLGTGTDTINQNCQFPAARAYSQIAERIAQ